MYSLVSKESAKTKNLFWSDGDKTQRNYLLRSRESSNTDFKF